MVNNTKGFSIVEVLLAVAVMAVIVTAFIGAIVLGEQGSALSGSRNRAVFLADEGVEALRNMRDSSYGLLTDGTFGLSTTGNVWGLSGSSDTTDIFNRTETIATSTESADRKIVTSAVNWTQNLQRSGNVTLNSLLSNWGRKFGNWALPSVQSTVNISGNGAGTKVAWQGNYAYVVRAANPNFVIIDISNSAAPSVVGSLSLTGVQNNIAVSGNYAYIASADDNSELKVVDVSVPTAPVLSSGFNAPGNADARGVSIVGTTVYLTRLTNADNFVVINVANPSAPALISSTSFTGPLYENVVMGNFVYAASGDDNAELKVINISSPATPTLTGTLNLAGKADVLTIDGYQNPNTVFMGQNDGTVDIADVSNPASPALLSTFAAGTSVNDVALGVSSGYLFMATSNNTRELQVLDISSPASPTLLSSLNLGFVVNGIVYDMIHDRAYAVQSDNANEFVIFKPS